jgi:hypothetical protein
MENLDGKIKGGGLTRGVTVCWYGSTLTPRLRGFPTMLMRWQSRDKGALRTYGRRLFIAVLTTSRHLALSWASSIYATLPHVPIILIEFSWFPNDRISKMICCLGILRQKFKCLLDYKFLRQWITLLRTYRILVPYNLVMCMLYWDLIPHCSR